MGRKSFEGYGALANTDLSATRRAGRYTVQAKAERRIAPDVARKLALASTDTLLDIGCGPGTVLRGLLPKVKSATALDHPETIARLRKELPGVSCIAGDFLEVAIKQRFSKIVTYSVIQYVKSENDALRFLDKAAEVLKPGGRILIGDLPNTDMRARFTGSPAGRRFAKEWRQQAARGLAPPPIEDPEVWPVNDAFVLRALAHCRANGLHAWVLPQVDLPFAFTREDLLIAKPG